jgi:serine/threonine-protein kinase
MATVYRGTDLRLGRTIALKVLSGVMANDPDFVERFTQEARATAALTHPNVVAVHDQGISAGYPYLVMEFVQGRTIREIMAQSGPFTSAHALEIISSVLAGLGSAHDAGFVHRDIKPENVLITNDGHIRVTDFGLARVISDTPVSDSTGGVLLGTMAYLSPEQVQQLTVDQRSDVYSCGILLYEMVTGVVPFTGASPLDVAYQHVNSAVSAPSSIQPDVPPAVDHLVLAATRKLPSDRLQSAREFRDGVIRAISAVPRAEALTTAIPIQNTQIIPAPVRGVHRATGPVPVASPNPGIGPSGIHRAAPPKRRSRLLAPLLLILALAIGGGVWYQFTGSYEPVPATTGLSDVPPIIGTTATDAAATLATLGLTMETTEEVFDDSIAGTVLSSDPVPGTTVPKGTVIKVKLSKGPVLVEVPKVVNMDVATATATLQAAGFQVKTVDRLTVVVLNRVYSQNPAGGSQAPKGSVITLEIV